LLPSPLPFLACFAFQTACPTTTFGQAPKLGKQLASDSLRRPLTRVRHFGSLRRADIPKHPFFFFSFSFSFSSFALVCVRAWCTVCCGASSVACFPLFTEICSNRLTSDFITAVFFSFATSNWIFSPFLFFLFFLGRFFAKLLMIDLRGKNHVAITVNKLCSERTASSSSQVIFFSSH
jgi:hypothetical protein